MTATKPEEVEALRPTDGIDMYGLYMEAVEVHPVTKRPRRYWRFFLANDHLYVYARIANKKATTWRKTKYESHDVARARLITTLQGNGGATQFIGRGEPILTQLRASDIIAIDKGQVPPSRYSGQQRVENAIGKFDLVAWTAADGSDAA